MSGPIRPPLTVSDTGDGGSVTGRPITTLQVSSGTLTISGTTATIATGGGGGSGTVTSITASSPLTGGTITSSGTIGIPAADSTTNGYLTSTDWNTFNNKGSGTVTGSGSANQVAVWSAASAVGGSSGFTWDATVLTVNSGATGDPKINLSSSTKAVSFEVETNQILSVQGGTDKFLFDVSSATGGITWPDGTTQITASTGTIGGSIANTQVAFGSGANTIQGSSSLTFDGTNLSVAGYVKGGNVRIGDGTGEIETDDANDLILKTNSGTDSGTLTLKNGSGGNLIFDPTGTGLLQIEGTTNPGAIKLMCEAGTHGITIESAPHASAATYKLVLPGALPADADNKYLVSDTSGNMSFTTASGGGSSGPPLSGVTYPAGVNWYGSQSFKRYRINSLPPYGTKAISNTSYTSSTDYDGTFYFPFYAPQTGTVDALSFNIITAASAGNLEVGVYSAGSGTNQYPATLLGKGSISITSAGNKAITSFTTGGGVSTTINVTQDTLYYIGYARTTSAEAYNVYGSNDLYSASSGINLGQAEQYVSSGGIIRSYATETAVPSSIASGSPTWDDFTVGNASWRRIVFNIEIGV